MSDLDINAHQAKLEIMDAIHDLMVLKNTFVQKVYAVAEKHQVNHEWLLQWAFDNAKLEEQTGVEKQEHHEEEAE